MSAPTDRRGFLRGLVAAPALGFAVPAAAAADSEPELRAAIELYHATEAAWIVAQDAVDLASERHDALGGTPAYPEALYQTKHDLKLGLHHTECAGEPDYRRRFPGAMVQYLRRTPCIRIVGHRRPATLADGFTQEEVESGVNFIAWSIKEPWPEAQARADEIIAAWDAWNAERIRRNEFSGLAAAETAEAEAYHAYKQAGQAVATTRATTMAGAMLKLAVVMSLYESGSEIEDEVDDPSNGVTFDYRLALSIVRDLNALSRPGPAP